MRKSTSYNNYMRYYSGTSSAVCVEEEPVWDGAKPAVSRPVRRPKRKTILFKHIEDNIAGISMYHIITIAIVFIGVVTMLVVSASIRRSQLDISQLRSDLRKYEEESATIKIEIAEKYDVAQIEKIATTRLGMSKPKPYQMVYISVPKESYVIQHTRAKEVVLPDELGVLERVTDFVVSLYSMVELKLMN